MKAPAEYLESAKIDELIAQYEAAGYVVRRDVPAGGALLDLVAERGPERIAVEVKARTALRHSAAEINELRTRALNTGFTEFRLVVVNPPLEKQIDIEGLSDTLRDYLVEHPTGELATLSSSTTVEGVDDVEVDAVEVLRDGVHVEGSGSVEVGLEWGGGAERDGVNGSMSFPLSFDIVLGRDLTIEDVRSMHVDTSSFYE